MNSSAPRHRDAFGLGGWLFADLLLAIAIIFIAASPGGVAPAASPSPSPSPSASPTPSPTPTPTPTPSPTPTPTTCPQTVILKKNEVTVPPISPGLKATDNAIIEAFRKAYAGKKVGLLLTFPHGTTLGAGNVEAARVNALIRRAFPIEVGSQTITEDYANEAGPVGNLKFIAYLIANTCQ